MIKVSVGDGEGVRFFFFLMVGKEFGLIVVEVSWVIGIKSYIIVFFFKIL